MTDRYKWSVESGRLICRKVPPIKETPYDIVDRINYALYQMDRTCHIGLSSDVVKTIKDVFELELQRYEI